MAWGDLVRRASKIARDGFEVNADFMKLLSYAGPAWSTGSFFAADYLWSEDFVMDGRIVQQGDTMTRIRLADTLDLIAEKGVGEFYNGSIARQIQQIVREKGGNITLEDLRNYQVKRRTASQIQFGDYKLFSCGIPAGGSVALSILNTIDGYKDFDLSSDNNTLTGLSTHRLTEAYRFAYGQRMDMGDPDFVKGAEKLQTEMLRDSYAAHVRSLIWDNSTLPPGDYKLSDSQEKQATFEGRVTPGTSYIAAADASGLAVSLTTTINGFWGSHVMTPGGFVMNNQMDDFSVPNRDNMFGYPPSEANYIAAGKRPISSISSTIVEKNGTLYVVTGSAGGSRIITTTVQNLIHILRQEMPLAKALGTPRIHDQLYPDHSELEWSFSNDTSLYLAVLAHPILRVTQNLGTAQVVKRWPNGTFDAAGEPRQVGSGGVAV
jgi:gamma-glutamyltranspeptidase / glutathione hydrolase